MGKCKAHNCQPEQTLHDFELHNGLEKRNDETTTQHAARCLAFMHSRIGTNIDTPNFLTKLAEATGVDLITVQAAIDERRAIEEER